MHLIEVNNCKIVLMIFGPPHTVVQTKSDSDVIIWLQL